MLDDDNGKDHHRVVNDLVKASATPLTLATPVEFVGCLESILGLPVVRNRDDKKPVEIMKAITGNTIDPTRLQSLRDQFLAALAIP